MTRLMPRIDVVIPAYNEEASIGRCLDATLGQSYPSERVRVLLVDAGCSDRTLEIARGRDDPRLVIVANGGRRLTTPEALNAGIDRSDAELVGPGGRAWLAGAGLSGARAGHAQRRRPRRGVRRWASAVCGRLALRNGVHARARLAFRRWGSVYAAPDRLVETDTVPWGMYRREALVDAGGFDPRMQHGEDEELNWRIRRSGGRILHNPQIRFRYVPRSSLGGVFRQYRDYGRARVRVVNAHPGFLRARHLAPAAMVAGGAVLAAAAPFSRSARARLLSAAAATPRPPRSSRLTLHGVTTSRSRRSWPPASPPSTPATEWERSAASPAL